MCYTWCFGEVIDMSAKKPVKAVKAKVIKPVVVVIERKDIPMLFVGCVKAFFRGWARISV
jgi:hypothetical protein